MPLSSKIQKSRLFCIFKIIANKRIVASISKKWRTVNKTRQEEEHYVEERFRISIIENQKTFDIKILDPKGEEEYQNLKDEWINFGEGFALIFTINERQSFEIIPKEIKREKRIKHKKKIPMILIVNYEDLANDRRVEYNEAKKLADSLEIDYIEKSAKKNENCKEGFEIFLKKVIINPE